MNYENKNCFSKEISFHVYSPNPDKPEPKLTAKTKYEIKKIEFGTRFDWLIADRNSQR
jgi:hypothetical protein